MTTIEEFQTLKDAENFILKQFEDGEDEVFLYNEYDDEYYVFLDDSDLEDYLKTNYEENGYESDFDIHMRGLNIFVYITEKEKDSWVSRYKNAELAFEKEKIYKKKIGADAEYEMSVSLSYY